MKPPEELMKESLAKWGEESQLDMVIEECAELIDAIQKLRRERVTYKKVVEEGVDVELCLEQLKMIMNDRVEWESKRKEKLDRLEKLLAH
ncbi:antitoxin [Candidatus Dojkabacteria bacterium]|jgi:hypothetical protein|nr:antitoxin [Candidatus Dojkabacteria bacterium]